MSQAPEVIVVCTGNTCRSPMAARLLEHALKAEDAPINQIRVSSAGVSAFAGDPPADNAVRALKKVNLDLEDHRSRRLTAQMVENALAVIVMTDSHRLIIESQLPNLSVPVILFREKLGDSAEHQVPDPIGGPLDDYLETRDALAEAVPSLIAWLKDLIAEQDQA